MRAFLAIELPESVRASLDQAIVRLRKSLGVRASWTRPSNLHITVRFLGDVNEGLIEKFSAAVFSVAAERRPVNLRIAGLGAFPSVRRARVLWCGGQGEVQSLVTFQARCEEAARDLGLEPEDRAWTPHVTLARFRQPPKRTDLQRALDTFWDYEAGEFLVPGVTLFSSRLRPQGAVHTPIGKFPFSCPPISSNEPSTTS